MSCVSLVKVLKRSPRGPDRPCAARFYHGNAPRGTPRQKRRQASRACGPLCGMGGRERHCRRLRRSPLPSPEWLATTPGTRRRAREAPSSFSPDARPSLRATRATTRDFPPLHDASAFGSPHLKPPDLCRCARRSSTELHRRSLKWRDKQRRNPMSMPWRTNAPHRDLFRALARQSALATMRSANAHPLTQRELGADGVVMFHKLQHRRPGFGATRLSPRPASHNCAQPPFPHKCDDAQRIPNVHHTLRDAGTLAEDKTCVSCRATHVAYNM